MELTSKLFFQQKRKRSEPFQLQNGKKKRLDMLVYYVLSTPTRILQNTCRIISIPDVGGILNIEVLFGIASCNTRCGCHLFSSLRIDCHNFQILAFHTSLLTIGTSFNFYSIFINLHKFFIHSIYFVHVSCYPSCWYSLN